MTSVLMTPRSVQDAVLGVFNNAQVQGRITDAGFTLECTLVEGATPFSLTKALDGKQFNAVLKKLFDSVQLDKTLKRESNPTLSGSQIVRISLVPQLSECIAFQRSSLEGDICELVIGFLSRAPEEVEDLRQLGLAPAQIADGVTEDDLDIFQQVCDRLIDRKLDGMIAAFNQRYPGIASALLARKVQAARKEGLGDFGRFLERIKSQVIGQDQAAGFIASVLTSGRKGSKPTNFLLVGPTGVGKTEISKATAGIMGDKFAMVPMNQYTNDMSVSTFFGSGVGYVGSQDKPFLATLFDDEFSPVFEKRVGKKQFYTITDAVLLLDELEKASPKLHDALFTLLDEGWCEITYTAKRHDGSSENCVLRYSFYNSVIFGTSNLFDQNILEAFRSEMQYNQIQEEFKRLNRVAAGEKKFSEPFMARFQVTPCGPIPQGEDYQAVIKLKMHSQLSTKMRQALSCKHAIEVEDETSVIATLERGLYGEGIDLRRIDCFFEFGIIPAIQSAADQIHLEDACITIKSVEGVENPSLSLSITMSYMGQTVSMCDDITVLVRPI